MSFSDRGGISAGVIDHVGIAVDDLDAAVGLYQSLLGASLGHRERLEQEGVELAFVELPGPTRLELIAPLRDGSGVARFLERRGPGLHHVCVLVDDIEAALDTLEKADVALLDRRPRRGAAGSRIAFVHPRALGGVLLELKEKATGRAPAGVA